jgi:Phage protein Gp19/Gp15/Gp42
LTDEETTLVATRLADVERMILRRIPDLADKITDGDIDEADVVIVEADVVLRLVRNPDGDASETDGTYGYTSAVRSPLVGWRSSQRTGQPLACPVACSSSCRRSHRPRLRWFTRS